MKDVYFEHDWDEAIAINRQLSISGEGVTAQNIIDLNRFCETCDDGEGYDVPKERMKSLKAVGLVDGGHAGWYALTTIGVFIYSIYFADALTNTTN